MSKGSVNEGFIIGKASGLSTGSSVKGALVGFQTIYLHGGSGTIKVYDTEYARGKNWTPRGVYTTGDGEFILPFVWEATDIGQVFQMFDTTTPIDCRIWIQTNVSSGNTRQHPLTEIFVPLQMLISFKRIAQGLLVDPSSPGSVAKEIAKKAYQMIRKVKLPTIKIPENLSPEYYTLLGDVGEVSVRDF